MQMYRLLKISSFIIISFLLHQKDYRDYFEFVNEITIRSIKMPVIIHPGYFAIINDAIIISYPNYGVFMLDTNGVIIKKLFDSSGPICVSEKDSSIYCWDVISHHLVNVKIEGKFIKQRQWSVPFQYVWQMQGFKDYIYLSLFYFNEGIRDTLVPAFVKFDPKSNTWDEILKVKLKPGEGVTGLFRVTSDGVIYFSFEDKIVKITPDGKITDFVMIKKQPEYYVLSFNIIESKNKIILEKSNRYRHKKVDIIDLKTAQIVAHDLKMPYSLIMGTYLDKVYIIVDEMVKTKLNQNCRIGVFKLKSGQ